MATPQPNPPEPALLGVPGLQAALPQLSTGFVLGLATGYAVRVLGRLALLLGGLLFISLQLLAALGVVTVDWLKLQNLADPWLSQQARPFLDQVWAMLTRNLPFSVSFGAGVLVGLRI